MKKVKLEITDAANFCHAASTVNGEVKVVAGKYVVNGKSILGILSLDLSNDIDVYVENASSENEENFWNQLSLMGIKTK